MLAQAGLAMASAKMRLFFPHEAAQQALKLNPELAETHEALAAVHRSTDFNWPQTIHEATRALELNPNLDQPHPGWKVDGVGLRLCPNPIPLNVGNRQRFSVILKPAAVRKTVASGHVEC